jgi:hypothetical protein
VFILRLTILHAPIANMLRPKPDGILPSAPPEIGRAGGLGRGMFRSRLRAPRRAIRMSTARKNRRGVPDRGVSFLFCPRSDSRNRIQPRFFDVGAGDRARSVVVGPVRTADVTLGVRSIAQGNPGLWVPRIREDDPGDYRDAQEYRRSRESGDFGVRSTISGSKGVASGGNSRVTEKVSLTFGRLVAAAVDRSFP